MGEMCVAKIDLGESPAPSDAKNHGTLKTDGKNHTILVIGETESVSEGVSKFLEEINQQQQQTEILQDFEFIHITKEKIEIEQEIADLLQKLEKTETTKETKSVHSAEKRSEGRHQEKASGNTETVYSSIFSLARSFHKSLKETRVQKNIGEKKLEKFEGREMGRTPQALAPQTSINQRPHQLPENRQERESEGKYEREGNGKQDQGKQEEKQQRGKDEKKKKVVSIGGMKASRDMSQVQAASGSGGSSKSTASQAVGSMENIFIRFMALMARILGQAELEAHQLYNRIKERTDNVDALTLLISKINSANGAIDWSNDEEMKKLVEKARAIGVDIPEGKYAWSEEEKKLLKENVQMRKDSMEKMTQLERTDMQRYLQEASQCHQARSNVLKLLKEVLDTIIHNMSPR